MGPPGAPPVRPNGWWYLVPALLAVLAGVLCVRAVMGGFEAAEDAAVSANAAAPGVDQTLTITDPGGYTVAYSGPILVRSTAQQEQLAEDLQLSIVPSDGGAALPLVPYEGLRGFEEDDQQYVPLLTVRFDEPGDYVLRSSYAGVDLRESALVVLESPYQKLRDGAERAVVILLIGLLLSILVTVILARTRGRAKRAIRAQMPPPATWPPQPAWGGPPPPGWGPPR